MTERTTGDAQLDALIDWENVPPGTGLISVVPAAEYPSGLRPTLDRLLAATEQAWSAPSS